MTLKEKFDWYLSGGEKCPESEECEKIAEEFAIGVLEWYFNETNEYISMLSAEKLLEVYKKLNKL